MATRKPAATIGHVMSRKIKRFMYTWKQIIYPKKTVLLQKQSLCCVFSHKWFLTYLIIFTPTVRMKRTVRRVKGTMIFSITVATFGHFHLYKIDSF